MPSVFAFVDHEPLLRYLFPEEVSRIPLSADALAIQVACQGRSQCFTLDLRPAFARDCQANGRPFEALDGKHWNGYANGVVAEGL